MDFTGGITNGQINDLSTYEHPIQVMGSPEFPEGGSPVTVHSYMSIDGVSDYLIIDHTEALALGKDNADFTVSFALL
ncbi:MAG: hypothetical protein QF535_20085 [Anaerolineales bacterium]|nr:hypothetical protein [Anaerolineales bacterium]